MKKIVLTLLPVISIACLFGSSKMLKPQTRIATVDGRPIVFSEMDSTLESFRKNSVYDAPSDSLKAAALDSLINRELKSIRVDSTISALDNDWEFGMQRRDNVAEAAKKVLFNKQISPRVEVDSADIEENYGNSGDEFAESESVKARHILIRPANPDTSGVGSEKKRQKLIDKADEDASKAALAIMEMALAGRDWDSLAGAYSEDKSNAARGGDLGYITRGRMVPEFDSVVFATEPGKIVGPISTKFGYHIIRIDDFKPKRQRPLDDNLRQEIRTKLSREQEKNIATAYMDSLKAAGRFEYNEAALESDQELPDETWIMAVNSLDTLYYQRYVESISRYMRWKQIDTVTVADKKDMLGHLASNFLLISAARTLGYFDDPEVVSVYDDFTYREAKNRVDNMLKDTEYEPSDKEIEDYYYSHIKDYTFERPLLVHHIIFEDSALASVMRDSILAGADFVEMAKKYYPGEPEIREVAYNLDYIGPDDMGREFFAAANGLDVGQISLPVKTQWGYHIIKLVSRKEDRTVKQVRPGIKQKLKAIGNEKYASEILEKWRLAANITIDKELYAKITPPGRKIIKIEAGPDQAGG